jgi:hypothetical protein
MFRERRAKFGHLDKKEDLINTVGLNEEKEDSSPEGKQELSPQVLANHLYALESFQTMVQSLKTAEGTTWTDDEGRFHDILHFIGNAINTINTNNHITKSVFNQKIIGPLKAKRMDFMQNNWCFSVQMDKYMREAEKDDRHDGRKNFINHYFSKLFS